jgi:hypothetical protein
MCTLLMMLSHLMTMVQCPLLLKRRKKKQDWWNIDDASFAMGITTPLLSSCCHYKGIWIIVVEMLSHNENVRSKCKCRKKQSLGCALSQRMEPLPTLNLYVHENEWAIKPPQRVYDKLYPKLPPQQLDVVSIFPFIWLIFVI